MGAAVSGDPIALLRFLFYHTALRAILLLIPFILMTICGCSLEAPTRPGALKIVLEERSTNEQAPAFLSSLLTAPTNTAGFSCFAVNVTGAGIPPAVKLPGICTTANNWRQAGPGIFSEPTARGQNIALDLPAGTGRTIDVYGLDPPPTQ